ncbi:MAG TPA: hypothetical protein VFY43_07135 [Candidatus Limnocylindria bacterium]|nr:hypothetical protein [Candidatus Limnocylindria bacterium]
MLRRLLPTAALLAVVLAACGGPSTPAIEDPTEIISQGLQATSEADSFHLDLTVSGNLTMPQTGGSFELDGTQASGDFDLANKLGHLTFEVPAIFNLSGEVLQIGTDSYLKTSVTGDSWSHSTVPDSGQLPTDSGQLPTDPDAVLDGLQEFLGRDGVETEKLPDVSCGDGTCYAVRLTIPASLLADAGSQAGVDPSQLVGDELVLNMQFDRENLHLTQLSSDLDAGELGTFGVLLTFSNYGEPVEVSPPPSDQVTEGTPQLPF